jgi:hypothetical protein
VAENLKALFVKDLAPSITIEKNLLREKYFIEGKNDWNI